MFFEENFFVGLIFCVDKGYVLVWYVLEGLLFKVMVVNYWMVLFDVEVL